MEQSPCLEEVKAEIFKSPTKAISFHRWMELCLYHPRWGYYCQEKHRFGATGDFFTNAQVGDLFGRMLGQFFSHTLIQEKMKERWALIEIGAGDGQLMNTIISFFRTQGIRNVDFFIVEKGKRKDHVDPSIQWVDRIEQVPTYPFAILYCNEWFDALPVYRIQKKEGVICEIFITWDEENHCFQEQCRPLSHSVLLPFVKQVEDRMEEGQSFEVPLDAQKRLQEIASWLRNGYLVTIDYGGEIEELLMRRKGTVRYFQKHRLIENTDLLLPGEVDITANVNFTWLREWGEELGLKTVFYGTQTQFFLQEDLLPLVKKDEERNQLKQLIHPDGMGEVFRVLIQKKAVL